MIGRREMNLVTIWVIPTENGKDDKIEINRGSRASEMVDITYTPGDSKTNSEYSFSLTRSGVGRYLENLLFSMTKDQDPFEKIQISTAMSPAIMYHVSDLDEVQSTILSMVEDALYVDVIRET
jgi:hypothetical protein